MQELLKRKNLFWSGYPLFGLGVEWVKGNAEYIAAPMQSPIICFQINFGKNTHERNL